MAENVWGFPHQAFKHKGDLHSWGGCEILPELPQRKTSLEHENLQRKQHIRILLRQGSNTQIGVKSQRQIAYLFQNISLLASFIWGEFSANMYKAVSLLHFKFSSESKS